MADLHPPPTYSLIGWRGGGGGDKPVTGGASYENRGGGGGGVCHVNKIRDCTTEANVTEQ